MEGHIKEPKSIVIDTNVIFSSLVKEDGYTQAILSIILAQKDIVVVVPRTVKTELMAHLQEIARKSGIPVKIIGNMMRVLFKNIRTVKEEEFAKEIMEALSAVYDESDAPFAGLAIKFSPSIILTYNKRHFNENKLENREVRVFTPTELVKHLDIEIGIKKKVKRKRGLVKLMSKMYLLKSMRR